MYKIENILKSYIKKNVNSNTISTEIFNLIIINTQKDILFYIKRLCNSNDIILHNSTIYLSNISIYNNIYPIEYHILNDIYWLKVNGCLFSNNDINDIYIECLFLIERYLKKLVLNN